MKQTKTTNQHLIQAIGSSKSPLLQVIYTDNHYILDKELNEPTPAFIIDVVVAILYMRYPCYIVEKATQRVLRAKHRKIEPENTTHTNRPQLIIEIVEIEGTDDPNADTIETALYPTMKQEKEQPAYREKKDGVHKTMWV